MKIAILLIVFILCLEIAVAEVVINELMFNPAGNEYDFEYLELYSDSAVDISGWSFEGIGFEFPAGSVIDGYLIVANTCSDNGEDNDFIDRYDLNCSFDYTGTLLNSGEIIILRDDGEKIIDAVWYDDWSQENHSIERLDINGYSSDPDNWKESVSGGSPGVVNGGSVSGGCDWKLDVLLNGTVFEKPKFKIKATKLEGDGKANFSVDKWIEDSEGNTEKEYSLWNIVNALNYKTSSKYSPTLAKGDAYFIKANITNISCEDTNLSNNLISFMVYVADEAKSTSPNSSMSVVDAPYSLKFGEIVKVKMNVYRGDTGKYAVYSYVQNSEGAMISEKSTMHLKDKFTNYSMTLPIQLKPNCNGNFKDGKYSIVVEGMDVAAARDIRLEGLKSSLCKGGSSTKSEESVSGKKFEYDVIEMPSEVNLDEDFKVNVEMKNNDNKDYTIEVWSYVYRGGKSYSGDREGNKEDLVLKKGKSKIVELKNKVEEGIHGVYKVKIKIRKNGQKTTNDITKEIKILEPKENESCVFIEKENISNALPKEKEEKGPKLESWYESVVYESTSFKAKKTTPYFFIGALSLLSLLLILTKTF